MPPMRPEELKYREMRQRAQEAWKHADDVLEAGMAKGEIDHAAVREAQDQADELDRLARQEYQRVNSNWPGLR